MKLAIMQPYFFPYIGYWQLIHAVDRFVIYDDVNFIKRGWVNRNRILINGQPTHITASIVKASQNKRICDLSLDPWPVWKNKMIKSIEMAYRKAPYFSEVYPLIKKLVHQETDNLSTYLSSQLKVIASFMGINAEFVVASRSYEDNDLSGQARILDICKREGATTYINLQGGQALYERTLFTQCGIDLKFLIPSNVEYTQFGSVCVPWLSIIDVMMFNSQDQLRTLLNKYELV
jgi:WbqC-like protein